jgi:hypothetical protein
MRCSRPDKATSACRKEGGGQEPWLGGKRSEHWHERENMIHIEHFSSYCIMR